MFRRRGRGRRFRARRRFRRGALLEKRNNYIEIAPTAIAETGTDTFSLLIGADSVTNNVSNDTNTADCEKGSKIIGGKVNVLFNVNTGSATKTVAWVLYKDTAFGNMTDIADFSDLIQPSVSQTVQTQKKYAVARSKLQLTSQHDIRQLVIGSRLLRKIGKLREGETVKLFVMNETTTATNAIQVQLYGFIKTIK